ncbi:TPA: hypothetical protein SUJ27_002090, partial [Streptococcus equi subsp. equi]|nr:hypothetical protein [Streptococcus equi subsp. equi]
VYPAYKFYCQDSGYKPLAKNAFNHRLRELSYENKNVKSGGKQAKNWVGFKLKSEF